jgi:carbon-monoxide dehydrogenase large subunit
MDMIDYAGLRREQAEKRERGELMGIGISSFTEIVGAGPSRLHIGLKMTTLRDRVHREGPGGSAPSQSQGHETTYAQIIAEELGFPVGDIKIEYGDTDTAPYGVGTYGSRSTPTSGASTAIASRKILAKARKLAAHLLEASEDDLEWEPGKFTVKGSPDRFKTIQDIAFAAYTNFPPGMEMGLEAVDYYDPPNLTFPFGSYICVVDIDKGTGGPRSRFVAVDDSATSNPMIVGARSAG